MPRASLFWATMGIPFFRTPLVALTLVWALATVLPSNARLPSSSIKHKRNWNTFSNQTNFIRENPAELQKRDGSKYVFMHHVRPVFFFCASRRQALLRPGFWIDCWQCVFFLLLLPCVRTHVVRLQKIWFRHVCSLFLNARLR